MSPKAHGAGAPPDRVRSAEAFDTGLAEAGLRALYDLAVSSGARAPEALARLAVDRVQQALGSDGAMMLVPDTSGVLQPLYQTRRTPGPPAVREVRPGDGLLGQAFRSEGPILVDDYASWPEARPWSIAAGVGSAVAVPLRTDGRTVGVLGTWSVRPGAFGAEEVEILVGIADQVAPAVDAARSVAALEANADTFVALHDLAVAAGSGADATELAARAVRHARRLLGMDRVVIYWWDERSSELLALAEEDSTGRRGPGWANEGEGAVGVAFARLEAVVVEDYQKWEYARPWSVEQGFRSAIAVPMLVKDRPVGAITSLSYETRALGLGAVRLLTLLAAQVTPALESARLRADLIASEQKFRSLYDTLPSGVVLQAPDGAVLDANRAAREMLGMRGVLVAEAEWDIRDAAGDPLPPEARPARRALETRLPVRSSGFRIRRPDRSWRWFEADSVPVLDRRGVPVEVVTSIVDVTERRRTQEALLESESRYHVLFDRVAIGILRLDAEAGIVEANPAVSALLGSSSEQLHGKPALAIFAAGDEQPLVSLLQGERDSIQFEARCVRSDGSTVWTSVTGSLVRRGEGQPAFSVLLVEDISQRKRQEAELEHQALHDALTALPNRILLHDRLHHAIRRAEREAGGVALLAVDLDRFKEVNDTHGHHAGDALLREVAGRLRAPLRETDTVARLGGDEFAVVLPGVGDSAGAGLAARRILRGLEEPFEIDGRRAEIGASIGIALFPDHGVDADTLLRHADVAMYAAKRSGSGHTVYSYQEDAGGAARMTLVQDLRLAIEGSGLYLEFQPKVRLRDGRVDGVEALVRWRHPVHGTLAPREFLPVAEQTGLIVPLTLWVLREAVRRAQAWQRAGTPMPVAVNVSARMLHDVELADAMVAMVESSKLPPGSVLLEIPEAAIMNDPELAASTLERLGSAGAEISIDDFGTGYSSLATLRRLPASEIKIDSSFVSGMPADEPAQLIVRSIIDLGHNLGRRVVAKGVQDEATRALLEEFGCDLAQGPHLQPPMAPVSVVRLVKRQARAS